METAELTKTVDQMAESFSEPTQAEGFAAWANRAEKEARQEKKKEEGKYAPRVISLDGRPEKEREFIKGVRQTDESAAKESPRDSAERGASVRNEQRSEGDKSTAAESTSSRVAPKEQGKLTQAEAEGYWRQISAGKDQAWQKAVGPVLSKALRDVENAKGVMQGLAAQPELVRDVRNVETAVQQLSTAHKSVSEEVRQATVRHPDAAEKIKAATTEVMSDKTPFFVKAFINDSEVLGELLYTLADATTLNNLLETAKANPGKALRVLHSMELDVQRALSKQKAPEVRPRAPKPPSEVGGRAAATDDDRTNGEMSFAEVDRKMRQAYAHGR